MNIAFSKHILGNGLEVLIHEDHGCPIVAVNVWYHVGSKNELPGRTGLAHLLEHLMFEGSEHHDHGYFRPLQEAGALLNGSTNADRTNYWEVVPTSGLDLALWMESDRMGYLLPALTSTKFENQRDVVLNERRQNYENRPYGLASIASADALYPPTHPYHWLTIGAPEDLCAATLDDVHAFFRRYYHPGNASLAIAGDVDTGEALALARRYFEEIEGGLRATVVSTAARLDAEVRRVVEDRVELPRLYLAWHSPAIFSRGDAELDLASELLANGKTSRLYRSLVYDRRIATEVAAVQNSREMSGFCQLIATAAPGHGLMEVERAVSDEIDRFAAGGPTAAELARVVAQAEAHFIYRLQTVGGFGGKSDQLNTYNVFLQNPGFFDEDLDRYRRVTAGGVQRAAQAHLDRRRRVTLSVVPRGRLDLAVPESTPAVAS